MEDILHILKDFIEERTKGTSPALAWRKSMENFIRAGRAKSLNLEAFNAVPEIQIFERIY